ncbi:MAG: TetR/AcrR family transcriptional regulator [Rhizobiales bacterium]|nr:TetR/AcrR family transcriptional regulator [Hyphomicrobiales bacterium]
MNYMRRGRVAQKQKTRQALLEAARYFLDLGHSPSVTEAADYAGISRATAYRYFSTPETLAQEAALDRLSSEMETIAAGLGRGADAEQAAADAMARYLAMVMRNEPLFRAYMALAARGDGASALGGRRLRWLRQAFAPLAGAMPQARFERLLTALSVLAGIETVVVLRDVCELSTEDTEETVRWMVSALVRASLEV